MAKSHLVALGLQRDRPVVVIALFNLIPSQTDLGSALSSRRNEYDGMTDLETKLLAAAEAGLVDEVERLLNEGAAINTQDEEGFTPLISACAHANLTLVKYMLARGADVLKEDNDGWTALYWAFWSGCDEIVDLLLRLENREIRHQDELNALLVHAARFGLVLEMSRLIGLGANVYGGESDHGWPPFDMPLIESAVDGHLEACRLLLDRGADVNARNRIDQTALMWAAAGGHSEVARLLLDRGANVDLCDEDGWSALSASVAKGDCEMAKLILEVGANVSLNQSAPCSDPLLLACEKGDARMVALLMDYGVDPNLKHRNGETAVEVAARCGHEKVVDLLIGKREAPARASDPEGHE